MAGDFDVAASAGKGALSGASTGAALGSAVPGIGTAIGAAGGAIIGGISSGLKANKAKKADENIQAQDPQELARLAEINRIRKSIGAGTDPLTQQAINQAQQTGASTQGNIARVTGGNVGATVAGLTRAQRGTQAATNQAVAGAQQRLPFFENLGQQLSTRISQRALEVGLMRRDQALAEKAAQGKAASANISGALGVLGNKLGGAGAPAPGSQSPPLAVDQSGGLGTGGLDKGLNSFTDNLNLNPLNETFINDEQGPVVAGNNQQSPAGPANPDLAVFGTDPKMNPFANPNSDPAFATALPGANPAEFIGGLLKNQFDQKQGLALQTAAIPQGNAFPDEHTGF